MFGTTLNMLAETAGDAAPAGDPGFLDRLGAAQLPNREQYLNDMAEFGAGTGAIWAVLLVLLGLLYLLSGWRSYKILVVLNGIALGCLVGYLLGNMTDKANLPLLAGIAGAVLFGILSYALLRGAIGVMGALTGAVIGHALWAYVAEFTGKAGLADYTWVGALLGTITLGLLGFLILQGIVMIFTSVQGSMMIVSGVLALTLNSDYGFPGKLMGPLNERIHLLPLLMGVPALLGFSLQYIASVKKAAKKKRAAG